MFQVARITYAHVVYAPMCTPIHIYIYMYILIQASDSEIKQLSKPLPHPATSKPQSSRSRIDSISGGESVHDPMDMEGFKWCPSHNYERAVEITNNNSSPVCRVAGGF